MAQSERLFNSEVLAIKKSPRQRRSVETVRRIENALLHIVAEEGYAAASTNRIAKRAKVNISSLYQYFPNRHAIALALFEGSAARLAQLVHQEMLAGMTEPLQTALPRLLERLLKYMEEEQATLMSLIDEVPDLRASAQAMSLENLVRDTSRAYLELHLTGLDPAAIACKLFFVQTTGMALIRRYVSDRPPELPRERFVAEISDLILSYLQTPPRSSAAVQ
jgi:AcrR family transcriptional regulator